MLPKRKTEQATTDAIEDANDSVSPPPATKKPRLRGKHTLESLLALSHEDLATHALQLQVQLEQKTNEVATAGTGAEAAWSEEKIAERATKTRDVCKAAIKKQMKWQPSCKTGTTKWSYTGIVPHEDVFYHLFGFEKPKKAWKQKKLTLDEFNDIFEDIEVSVRYSTLSITGKDVKIGWDQEEKTFKLSGTYGI